MKRLGWYAAVFLVLFLVGFTAARQGSRGAPAVRRAQIALGTVVEIEVRGLEQAQADRAIEAAFGEIRRVEALLGSVGKVGPGTYVPEVEVDLLMQECDRYWRLSSGAFDCSLGALAAAWGFATDDPAIPPPEALEAARDASGWEAVSRQPDGSWFLERERGFNFGGIGKGYAVDRAMAVLTEHGVEAGMVNAGGDLRSLGPGWTAGIQHPRQPDNLTGRIQVADRAVATSGDYEQFFILDGQRYHHILDPRRGWPAGGMQSVTVLAPACMEADALATAIFVLGKEAGLTLADSLAGVEVYLVDETGVEAASSGWPALWLDE